MKQSEKKRRQLARRLAAWNEVAEVGMSGPRDKVVRGGDGKPRHSYRRPGSQNGRK